ncbi:energy-coupling factor ABC transporter permease [Parasutterella excrementihominis]|nr:energy-coupling factor ABC transporter permease [Parasutterella excrementihominis]
MHIAEGVLSAPVLITGAVVAAAGVAYGLKKSYVATSAEK